MFSQATIVITSYSIHYTKLYDTLAGSDVLFAHGHVAGYIGFIACLGDAFVAFNPWVNAVSGAKVGIDAKLNTTWEYKLADVNNYDLKSYNFV